MIYIGIDNGYNNCGLAVFDSEKKTIKTYSVLNKSKEHYEQKLINIELKLKSLLEEIKTTEYMVCIEAYVNYMHTKNNTNTLRFMNQSIGWIRHVLSCDTRCLAVTEVMAREWQLYYKIKKNSKDSACEVFNSLLDNSLVVAIGLPANEHEIDACLIAYYMRGCYEKTK